MRPPLVSLFYFLLLVLGIFACSTSVILIRHSELHPALLAAWRLILAALFLSPLWLAARRREKESFGWRQIRRSFIPGFLLALHFISWAAGARMTFAANATLIVNMVPLVMPFILFLLMRERINRAEIAGTLLGLLGVIVLSWGDYRLEPANLAGDFVCFASMVLFALYLGYGRLNREVRSIWLYLVPLYAIAGIICLVVALPFAHPLEGMTGQEWLLMLGLAFIPTILGHSLLNFSLKHFGGQAVSVCNLGQFIFAGVLAWVVFNEVPHGPFYVAGVLVVLGAAIVVFAMPRSAPPPVRAPIAEAREENT